MPKWGDAKPSEDSAPDVRDDSHGFSDIVKVFVRTWPFLIPLVLGYWREMPLLRSSRLVGSDTDWRYHHAPLLATILAAIGPFTVLAFGESWQVDLLATMTLVMAVVCWALLFLKGRSFFILATALVVLGASANLFAILVVTGWQDNLQVGVVTVGCLSMWLLQYRRNAGVLELRLRLGCHLVYYYALVWLASMVGIITGFFTIDLLNQSILQAQPLTPFLADFVGRPELAAGTAETLTNAQRHDLQWLYIVFLVAIGIVMFPLNVVRPYYNVWIMQQINENLRLALVERWHQLSLRYHGDHRVGDSVYRLYQDSAQVTAIVGMVISILTQITQYVVTILFVAALDPWLGVLALTVGLFAIAWAFWFSPRMRTRSLTARETNSDVTSRAQEVLGALSLVKASGTEETEQARFEEDSVTAFNSAYRVRSLVAAITIIMFTLAAATLLGGEFLMAVWASENRETFAAVLIGLVGLSFVRWNLAAFQWGQGELFGGSVLVQGLLRQWTMAQDMAMGLERVFRILDIEPEVVDAPSAIEMPPFSHDIVFENVGFAYSKDQPILVDASFRASRGSITAIVGPTGSGKSTLVAMLTRLFDPDSGRITIDGRDIRQIKLDSLRNSVSIALQENILFAMSLRDNIRYVVPEASDDEVRHAAQISCVDDFTDQLPNGYDTLLGDRGGKLSTGQRQRLSIARAVIKDTPILILDEPTAALDAITEQKVLARLSQWGSQRAILLITHRISTIRQADQILYLDDGHIAEQGTHDELMGIENGRYRQFVVAETQDASDTQDEDVQ